MGRTWGRRGLVVAWVLTLALLALSFLPGPAPQLVSVAPWLDRGGYPQRIGFVRDSSALPDRPGPVALVLDDNNFGAAAWEAVAADGTAWRIADGSVELLSDDGAEIVLAPFALDPADQTFVVRDLRTGVTTTLPMQRLAEAGAGLGLRRRQTWIDPPVAWSTDRASLLVPLGGSGSRATRAALVEVATGTVTPLPLVGDPVGFLSDERVVAVATEGPEGAPRVEARLATPTGEPAGAVALHPEAPWAGENTSRGWALSPSDELLVWERPREGDTVLRWFDLESGAELSSRSADLGPICAVGWQEGDPVVSTRRRPAQVELVRVGENTTQALLGVHHRAQSVCVRIAADALELGPTPMTLGSHDPVWTWYWRQLAFALLLAGGLAWITVARRTR